MDSFLDGLQNPVNLAAVTITGAVLLAGIGYAALRPRFFMLMLKNLRRNLVRTVLIGLASTVLVLMITLIWSILYSIDQRTTEKAANFRIVITERWQVPSQMPRTHASYLDPESPRLLSELKGVYGSRDFMTWSFYGGTLDPKKFAPEDLAFFFVMNPGHITTMMEDLEDLDPKLIQRMQDNRTGVLMGRERLEKLNKKVGDRVTIHSINYKGIDLDLEIIGELPEGRYNLLGILNERYFNEELDRYEKRAGMKHPLDQKRLNLIWIRVPDRATFEKVGSLIENSPYFADRPVKVETESSGISSWIDAYRTILDGMKYLLVPAMLFIMSLVVANAISISVRERRSEIAVMKVLGFRPGRILIMVLGEGLMIGGLSGAAAIGLAYLLINVVLGGIKFPIAFFPVFFIPAWALAWGPAMGCFTAFLGSIVPAWSAQSVKVNEVFAKVA